MDTNISIYEYAKVNLAEKERKSAIWFYGNSINFKECFEKIDNIADNLCNIGIKFGDVITIHAPNCPEAIMAIYAIAKIGAIANLVHPLMPLTALKENMKRTQSRVLISSNIFKDAEKVDFAEHIYCVRMSQSMGFISKAYTEFQSHYYMPKGTRNFIELEKKCKKKFTYPNAKFLSDKCVCYMHSSGSTGSPKIVMHSHKNINNWAENYRNYRKRCNFSANPVSSSFLPLFHGAGFAEGMHVQFSAGWEIILISKINIKQIIRLIKRKKICKLRVGNRGYCGF